jgi:hypothetical protein
MTARALTPAAAYAIASCWGSYLHSADPGACLYGFRAGDGRPASEPHRAQCLRYVTDLINRVETKAAKRELVALERWFLSAPLWSEARS